MTKRSLLVLLAALAAAGGCALSGEETAESGDSAYRQLERRAVGHAAPYPADTYTQEDDDRFARSKKARRELGWRVLAKALEPVKLAEQNMPSYERTYGQRRHTLPRFRTWFGADEVERMFAKLYADMGAARRRTRWRPLPWEIHGVFDWNATALNANSEADYFERVKRITDRASLDGLGGNARAAYSPGYVKHLFEDYDALVDCKPRLDAFDLSTAPPSSSNFANCMSSEFPVDAAVIKQSWRRNDAISSSNVPVIDTSAAALKKRVVDGVDDGAWNLKLAPRYTGVLPSSDIYDVKLSDGSQWALTGLHVMTKELRHWVWVTVWWSPNADEDFGQDRPQFIKDLGEPWSSYKMCVVTDFDEHDPDPRGGFDGSLGDALAATHGQHTWCSNGFIEKGKHNAQTNCIGCHQHAGDIRALDKVLTTFPNQGRGENRLAFPMDYSWAIATPPSPDTKDRFLDMLAYRVGVYDNADRH